MASLHGFPNVQTLGSWPTATRSASRVLRVLSRTVATALYCRELQHITVQPIAPDAAMAKRVSEDGTVECVIVSSLEALEGLAPRISRAFRDSVSDLARRVAHGCVLTVALRRRERGMSEVVGYELAEQGVFSALGRRRHISSEVVFSHWAEVLPAYRGRRIHALLFATRDAYFSERGGKIVVGVVAPRNRASLQALARAGSAVVGTVERRSLLRGAIARETPWPHIHHALLRRPAA